MARQLKTSTDLRRYLASVINRVEDGTLNPTVAGRLAYITNILKSIIEAGDLEERVAKLETLLKENEL